MTAIVDPRAAWLAERRSLADLKPDSTGQLARFCDDLFRDVRDYLVEVDVTEGKRQTAKYMRLVATLRRCAKP